MKTNSAAGYMDILGKIKIREKFVNFIAKIYF